MQKYDNFCNYANFFFRTTLKRLPAGGDIAQRGDEEEIIQVFPCLPYRRKKAAFLLKI